MPGVWNVAGECTRLKPTASPPDPRGMGTTFEPLLIVVGLGVAGFALAAMAIASATAQDSIKRHMVQVRAMQLRNEYLRTVLSLRGLPDPYATTPQPGGDAEMPAPEAETASEPRAAA